MLDLENLLTQFFKLRNIPTYSLQEGVYFIFKKNPPLDSVQYENFETDNLLCWGQFSIDEDVSYGISPRKLRLAGYPKKSGIAYNEKRIILIKSVCYCWREIVFGIRIWGC